MPDYEIEANGGLLVGVELRPVERYDDPSGLARAGAEAQREIEVRFPPDGLRARLLARRAAGQ